MEEENSIVTVIKDLKSDSNGGRSEILRTIPIPYILTQKDKVKLNAQFPGYDFVSKSSTRVSQHLMLHCERIIKEMVALDFCGDVDIVDIGGNPIRHRKFNRTNVWSACPILTAADTHRGQKFAEAGVDAYCNHVVPTRQDCPCNFPEAWLAIDSLYYFTQKEVTALVQKAPLTAVFHDFSHANREIYEGEAKYSVDATGSVTMTVRGSSIAYKHSALGWVFESNYCFDTWDNMGMSWSHIATVGSSVIFRFVANVENVIPDPMPRHVQLTNDDLYGSTASMNLDVLESYNVTNLDTMVLPWGKVVVVRTGKSNHTIPKHVITHARIHSLALPRNKDTFAATVRKTKEYVIRYMPPIPQDQQPTIILFGAAIGFVMDIKDEISVMQNIAGVRSVYGQVHEDSLNFKLLKPSPFWSTVSKMLCALGLSSLKNGVSAKGSYLSAPTEYVQSVQAIQGRDHGSLATGGYVGPDSLALPSYHCLRKVNNPNNGTFKFSYQWKKERVVGPYLHGMGLANSIPVVSADTPLNEERAVVQRLLTVPLVADEDAWLHAHKFLQPFLPSKIIRATSFEIWNSRFPTARRIKQEQALETFSRFPSEEMLRRACDRKVFVKREKLFGKSSDLGCEDYNSRAISATNDLPNAVLGPWMHAFSKHLSQLWHVDKMAEGYPVYASGMTAEQLGLWMAMTITLGCLFWYESDFTAYDASQCQKALYLERSTYLQCGVSVNGAIVLEEQSKIRGRTSHGHVFTAFQGRNSGDPNTSCGNSMSTTKSAFFVMYLCKVFEIFVLVLGDDVVIATKVAPSPENLTQLFARLGLVAKVKMNENPYLTEFCSGRFWRCSTGIKWGPKPGRFLSKIGYSVSKESDPQAWFKGVLLGVNQDVSHIPFINTYVSHCLTLLTKVKGRARVTEHVFHAERSSKPTAETYDQIMTVYGLGQTEIDSFSLYIKSIKALPCELSHPVLDRLVEVDR